MVGLLSPGYFWRSFYVTSSANTANSNTWPANSNPNTNAVAPQRLEVYLKDGRKLEVDMPQIFGHPENPLSDEQNIEKFKRAWSAAAKPLSEARADQMIEAVSNLEGVEDVRSLIDLTIA